MNEFHDNIPSVYNQIHTSGTESWKEYVIPSIPISCQSIIATWAKYKTKSKNSIKYYNFFLVHVVGNYWVFLSSFKSPQFLEDIDKYFSC